MSSGEDAFDGVGGPRGLVPTDLPWTPEAGFVTERPPVQIEDAVERALTKTRQRAAVPPESSAGESRQPAPDTSAGISPR